MNIESLENWLSELPNNRKLKLISYLFAPIIFILELACWFKIWRKIVLPALIETDEIFEFFSGNDFVYRKWFRLSKFEKIDIVPIVDNQFYAEIKDSEKLRQAIRQEYINTFLDILEDNSPLDLNNYINLQCAVSYKVITGLPTQRIYKITIQYWRHTEIIKALINTFIWGVIVGVGYAVGSWLLIIL